MQFGYSSLKTYAKDPLTKGQVEGLRQTVEQLWSLRERRNRRIGGLALTLSMLGIFVAALHGSLDILDPLVAWIDSVSQVGEGNVLAAVSTVLALMVIGGLLIAWEAPENDDVPKGTLSLEVAGHRYLDSDEGLRRVTEALKDASLLRSEAGLGLHNDLLLAIRDQGREPLAFEWEMIKDAFAQQGLNSASFTSFQDPHHEPGKSEAIA